MEVADLAKAKCVPCRGGIPPLSATEAARFLPGAAGWELDPESTRLSRIFEFKDFAEAMSFVNSVARLAEQQGHHPDFEIHWNTVKLVLWTHKIHGLHENDFVMAAQINGL